MPSPREITRAPYAGVHAEDIRSRPEPVYILVGKLHETPEAGAGGRLRLGKGFSVPVDPEAASLLRFFQAARTQPQGAEWSRWAGVPAGLFRSLVARGYLRRIDAHSPERALRSFRGLRLAADAASSGHGDRITSLMPASGDRHSAMSIYPSLAAVLWDGDGRSIPAAVAKYTRLSGQDRAWILNHILADLPMLVEFGHAHLEPVRLPWRLKAGFRKGRLTLPVTP